MEGLLSGYGGNFSTRLTHGFRELYCAGASIQFPERRQTAKNEDVNARVYHRCNDGPYQVNAIGFWVALDVSVC